MPSWKKVDSHTGKEAGSKSIVTQSLLIIKLALNNSHGSYSELILYHSPYNNKAISSISIPTKYPPHLLLSITNSLPLPNNRSLTLFTLWFFPFPVSTYFWHIHPLTNLLQILPNVNTILTYTCPYSLPSLWNSD